MALLGIGAWACRRGTGPRGQGDILCVAVCVSSSVYLLNLNLGNTSKIRSKKGALVATSTHHNVPMGPEPRAPVKCATCFSSRPAHIYMLISAVYIHAAGLQRWRTRHCGFVSSSCLTSVCAVVPVCLPHPYTRICMHIHTHAYPYMCIPNHYATRSSREAS